MKKISSNSIANTVAVVAVVLSIISLNKSCQSMAFSTELELHSRKSALISSSILTKIDAEYSLQRFIDYRKEKNDNQADAIEIQDSLEKQVENVRHLVDDIKLISDHLEVSAVREFMIMKRIYNLDEIEEKAIDDC